FSKSLKKPEKILNQNYSLYVSTFSPKKEKSPTYCDFENFDPTPNLKSNFEIYKKVGDNILLHA
ncbi:MAG: hypothetical protein AAF146_26290, partial [Bacteroidota bacterium]